MQKITLVLMLSSLLINTIFSLQAKNRYLGERRVTKLLFYVQVMRGGEQRTEWTVARSNISDNSPSAFGVVSVSDNPMTSRPGVRWREIGRTHGVVATSDFRVTSLAAIATIVFTCGKYKGSTFNILGRIPLIATAREIPIVGGTGVFRMASGYIISKTFSIDEAGMRDVYQYNATVFSYGS